MRSRDYGSKNAFKAGVADKWLRAAILLRRAPYSMTRAADYLEKWVKGELEDAPELDVSYVTSVSLPPTTIDDNGEDLIVDLAPKIARVKVKSRSGIKRAAATPITVSDATPRARYVFPMARELVVSHHITWREAIKVASKCWDAESKSRTILEETVGEEACIVDLLDEPDDEDGADDVLEEEPCGAKEYDLFVD